MGAVYPHKPGAKARDTSFSAAASMGLKVGTIRARVYDAIAEKSRTPEEIAVRIGEPVMNVRPRASELAAMGLIKDSGLRREAMGGKLAIVWAITGQPASANPQSAGGQLAHAA